MTIVVIGNYVSGLTFFGPFLDYPAAENWGRENLGPNGDKVDWRVVPLDNPRAL